MRENRKLVSQTFMYLMVPLHGVLIGILLFVTEVMVIFATQLNNIQTQALTNTDPTTTGGMDVTSVLAFASPNIAFIRGFALVVTIVLTVVDTWSPHATSGGHHHKVWLYAAFMLVMSGLALMLVPHMVGGLFHSVAGDLSNTTARHAADELEEERHAAVSTQADARHRSRRSPDEVLARAAGVGARARPRQDPDIDAGRAADGDDDGRGPASSSRRWRTPSSIGTPAPKPPRMPARIARRAPKDDEALRFFREMKDERERREPLHLAVPDVEIDDLVEELATTAAALRLRRGGVAGDVALGAMAAGRVDGDLDGADGGAGWWALLGDGGTPSARRRTPSSCTTSPRRIRRSRYTS